MERRKRSWQRFVVAPRRAFNRYALAVLLASTSLLLVYLLPAWQADEFSSLALFSVVLSALYGGLGPALLDTAISAIGIDYLFSPPLYRVFDSWSSVLRILVFALVGYLIAGIVASLREAYRQLQEKQRETERAKQAREDVLAMVSHDLRSPLSSILLGMDYLKRAAGSRPAEELREAAEAVLRSGRQMGRLIDDLLDAVRIENGQFRIELRPYDLAILAEDALQGVRAAAQAKGVQLRRTAAEGDYRMRCDPGRITQALANLLGNAVKFSPKGEMVELELRACAAQLELKISDSGRGIAAADLPRLFARYWQAQDTAQYGTGLGLFITKSIVDAHGGRIEVASRPGEGAAFTVVLPR